MRASGWTWRAVAPAINGRERRDREIDIDYPCVLARRSIVFVGQRDYQGAGRFNDRRNDFARNALIVSPHAYQSDEVHFECKLFHGGGYPYGHRSIDNAGRPYIPGSSRNWCKTDCRLRQSDSRQLFANAAIAAQGSGAMGIRPIITSRAPAVPPL